ncbi:copper resistance CopC family protein [Glutamicibacter bergerei]|uniref:Copper resistance protein CopC n=1 Tax=Glutamicibacter bergerei TaxID=256702 RepID=A0ABV9MR85_9MICC|nr:hypothetical protein [Micrococcaceae bacterium]
MNSLALQHSRILLARLSAAILIALVAVFSSVSAASAHDELVSSNPVAGSTMTKSPEKIELNFSGVLQQLAGAETSVVALSTEDGTKLASEVTTKGKNVTVVPEKKLDSGTYKLVYRVVSSDGHPIEASFNFTVKLPVAASATPSDSVTNAPAPSAPAEQNNEPIQQLGSQVSPVIWVIVGIAILGAAIAVLVKFTRQNK